MKVTNLRLVRVCPGILSALLAATVSAPAAAPDPKDVPPAVQMGSSSFWNQQYMLGDWGGTRTELAKEGVTFDFNDIGDFLTNVSGSETHHATYFGRIRASTDIDFNKLSGFDGEFFFSGIYQYGENLSGSYLHVNTLTSSIAGPNSARVDQAWYQQGFFDSKLKIKLGQVAAVNEFGATDFFDILFNDELGYAPNTIFNTKQPFSPAGKPGVIITGDLSDITKGLYVKGGVFASYGNPYHPDNYGLSYGNDFDYGPSASFEIGYHEQNTNYPGVYKLGVNGNEINSYANAATGENYTGDYNGYLTMEKTVYHPTSTDGKLDLKKGLDLLLEVVGEPGDRNPLQYEVTAGARYSGLIPGRPLDKTGLGFIYSANSDSASEAYQNVNGRSLSGEATLEADYQFNPAPWLSIQPDVQYIIDPGGDSDRSNIVVLGLRTIVQF